MSGGHGRAVLVTGATRGIGLATARRLDDIGFRVFAGYRSDDDARRVAETGSSRITPIRLDVTDTRGITSAADRIARETEAAGLWGLVNNAGIVVPGPLEVLPLDDIRYQFEVNTIGMVAVTQAVLPLLRRARGRIVNVSSVNGRIAAPWSAPYAASKHALEALSDGWRVELARWGIEVSVIEPGAIQTDIWDTSRERGLRISGGYTPEARTLYGGLLDRLQEVRTPARAIPPERVAARIAHALTARRPRVRYVVGWDARVALIVKALLPARWFDRVLGARRRRRLAASGGRKGEPTPGPDTTPGS